MSATISPMTVRDLHEKLTVLMDRGLDYVKVFGVVDLEDDPFTQEEHVTSVSYDGTSNERRVYLNLGHHEPEHTRV